MVGGRACSQRNFKKAEYPHQSDGNLSHACNFDFLGIAHLLREVHKQCCHYFNIGIFFMASKNASLVAKIYTTFHH